MSFTSRLRRSVVSFLKATPLGCWRALYLFRHGGRSQSDESDILIRLTTIVAAPKVFVEFGFDIHEFNCIGLINEFSGLLIDGDARDVAIANRILPPAVKAEARFLTLENLDFIGRRYPSGTLGILSIDVDGNDYWFLKALLPLRPAIISVEYNASFGLRAVTVPYDPAFMRLEKDRSGWYHGASITALNNLCEANGYDLVAVSSGGINLFFVRSDVRPTELPKLSAHTAWRENTKRSKVSGLSAEEQWRRIQTLPYVTAEVNVSAAASV